MRLGAGAGDSDFYVHSTFDTVVSCISLAPFLTFPNSQSSDLVLLWIKFSSRQRGQELSSFMDNAQSFSMTITLNFGRG